MPTTRSGSKNGKHPKKAPPVLEENGLLNSDSDISDTDDGDILVQIKHFENGVKKMRKELKNLRLQNAELQKKIEAQQAASSSKVKRQADITIQASTARIETLEETVRELQATNKKQNKRIEKLRAKEAKAEIDDLKLPQSDDDLGDPMYRMRKLLRRFSDLMLVTTLGETEDEDKCPICLEKMELKKCSSLPCQHLMCNTCLPHICKGADETVRCPTCRGVCPRDEVELIHYTESGRWDALLDVAKAWAAFDLHGEGTSEEELEEDFLTEGNGSSEVSPEPILDQQEQGASEDARASAGDAAAPASMPPSEAEATTSYSQSPARVKRRILEQMAEERARKKRR